MSNLIVLPNVSPEQITTPLTDYDFVYEITLAFSTKHYSIIEAFNKITEATIQLNDWLAKVYEVEKTIFVTEYTKKLHPHVHIAICCTDALSPEFRSGVIKGLRRICPETRATFSNCVSKPAFNDYLEKDLSTNYTKSGINHKTEYYRR